MSKINPFNLKVPELASETRTFVDPGQPGVELTITLRALDEPERHLVADEGAELVRMYCGTEESRAEKSCPFIGGRRVLPSRSLLFTVAYLQRQQVCESPDDAYTIDQWLGLSLTMPVAFRELTKWSNLLGKTSKNDSEAATEPLS